MGQPSKRNQSASSWRKSRKNHFAEKTESKRAQKICYIKIISSQIINSSAFLLQELFICRLCLLLLLLPTPPTTIVAWKKGKVCCWLLDATAVYALAALLCAVNLLEKAF